MSAPVARGPVIGGVAGGCGTSLIAALVGATDGGQVRAGESVDVLVCRSISSHLTEVTSLVHHAPRAPIVVVNADAPLKVPGVVRDRARMLEPHVPAVLWLDFLTPLRAMTDPIRGARAEVLAVPVSPPFRKAFEFRQRLVDALVDLLSEPESAPNPESSAGYTVFRQTS